MAASMLLNSRDNVDYRFIILIFSVKLALEVNERGMFLALKKTFFLSLKKF